MSSNGINITLNDLIKLRHAAKGITLASARAVINTRTASYQSRFRGRGIDFDEVRSYQPGDDIRTIDWRVTARTGKPHTKVFREERERTVLIVVDNSASMQFGTQVAFKSVIAAQTAALLAWAAIAGGDQVGGLVFSETNHYEIPPNPGQAGILPLLKTLTTSSSNNHHTSSFSNALHRLQHVAKAGSLIFIISDFYQWNEQTKQYMGQLAQHNDIAAIQIYDALEKHLPLRPSLYTFTQDGSSQVINTASKDLIKTYTEQFEQRQQALQQFMRSLNKPLISIATHQSPRAVLAQFWAKRG